MRIAETGENTLLLMKANYVTFIAVRYKSALVVLLRSLQSELHRQCYAEDLFPQEHNFYDLK